MNDNTNRILEKMINIGYKSAKMYLIGTFIAGFISLTFFIKFFGGAAEMVRESIIEATNKHTVELSKPMNVGEVFTDDNGIEFKIIDSKKDNNIYSIIIEASALNADLGELGDVVLKNKEAAFTTTIKAIPKGYLSDEEKYNSFIKEGIQSNERQNLDFLDLDNGYQENSGNPGFISVEPIKNPVTGRNATYNEVYLDYPRIFHLTLDTDQLDGFVIMTNNHYSSDKESDIVYFNTTN